MRKIHINITIDQEVLTELQSRVDNVSGLINDLLESYLQIQTKESTPEFEIDKKINELTAELNGYKNDKAVYENNRKKQDDEFNEKIKKREIVRFD